MDGIANHFPANSAQYCTILHIQSQIFFGGDIPGHQQKLSRCLDPDANFRLARQRSHCSCLTKRSMQGSLPWQLGSLTRLAYLSGRRIRSYQLSTGEHFRFPPSAKIWNALPDNVVSASFNNSFRHQLKTYQQL